MLTSARGGSRRARASDGRWRSILSDISASIVVFLVAVPLSMGIALASGAPIISGLVAAAIGGVVVGLLGGAPLQVSGPAAGLAVLVFDLVSKLGWPAMGMIVLAAGVLQMMLGLARVARAALAMSPAVIHGMLAGIGLQIALAQLHVLLGGGPHSSAVENALELPSQIANLHGAASSLGLVTIAILLAWPMLPWGALRRVPGPLVAVAAVTLAAFVLRLDAPRVELPTDLTAAIRAPSRPHDLGAFALAAATIAFVASAESLLCAVATDGLHSGPRAKLDRELFAQGLANTLSGLVGGLPVTGVIVRSTANISAGAKTRLSAVLHGVWVIVATTMIGSVLTRIPLSALAGLLVVVGLKLFDPTRIRVLARHGELSTFLVTLSGVVAINLLAGIALGFLWTAVRLLRRRSRVTIEVEDREGHHHVIVKGAFTFLGVPTVTAVLSRIPPGRHVDIDLRVEMMDHAAFEALHVWREGHERQGGHVDIDQSHEHWSAVDDGEKLTTFESRPTPPVRA